jgi:O-antigen/teichoic acid export membrane protein
VYNTAVIAGERILPFEFNVVYHIGADTSLIILLLAGLVQYILMSPIHEMIHNKSVKLPITGINEINKLLRKRYILMIKGSIVTSGILTTIFYLVGPSIVSLAGGTKESLFVLYYSSVANIFLSLFITNSQFMVLMGRAKHLAILVIAAAIINAAIGFRVAPLNFEYAVFGYLAASILLSSISTIYITRLFKNMSSILFARFV